jgi:hypothetical protein
MIEKNKIFLYEELYYWMYFYTKKLKPYFGPKYVALMCLHVLKLYNILSLWLIIGDFFIRNEDYLEGILSFLFVFWLVLFALDLLLLYPKRDYIITTYEKFPAKRKTIGKIKFWIYIVLTIIFLIAVFPGKG